MSGRIDGLDLLRGIAIGLVMHRHAWPEPFPGAAALAGLAALTVVPLRGHALTYLAGGPVIATLTAVPLSWRTWAEVSGPALRPLAAGLTLVLATLSWRLVEQPTRRPRVEAGVSR